MKKNLQLIKNAFVIILMVAGFWSCEKIDPLEMYGPGTASTLTASANNLAPVVADSSKNVMTLNWTNPNYSVDSSTVKYVIQVDSIGRNFSKAAEKLIQGKLSASFTAKEINTIALGFGFAFNKSYNMEMRIISSHANNNERLVSNAFPFKYTPYVTPPKVTPPKNPTKGGGTGVKIPNVSMFASGGFPTAGQLFVARESGAEMVGSVGGRTAVANKDQIVQAVSAGVANAVAAVLGNNDSNTTVNIYLDDILTGKAIINSVNRTMALTGKTLAV
jgi:hypothetical protein